MAVTLNSIVTRRMGLSVDLKRLAGDVSRIEGEIGRNRTQCETLEKDLWAINKEMEGTAKEMWSKRNDASAAWRAAREAEKQLGSAKGDQKKAELLAKLIEAKDRESKSAENAAAEVQKRLEKRKEAGLSKGEQHMKTRAQLLSQADEVGNQRKLCLAVDAQADTLIVEVKRANAMPGQINEETSKIKAVKQEASRMATRLKDLESNATATAKKQLEKIGAVNPIGNMRWDKTDRYQP